MMKKFIVTVVAACLWSSVTQAAISETWKQKYNEAYLSMIAAAACVENYLGANPQDGDFLHLCGWKMSNFTFVDKKVHTHFALGSKATSAGAKIYLLSFRGTSELKDWHINLRAGHSNYGGNTLEQMRELAQQPHQKLQPAVHKGFSQYVDQVLANFVLKKDGITFTHIFQEIRDNPQVKLIITGHSLGGAAATLLGQRLYDLGIAADQFQVITFGAPAVGNAAFAAQYGNRIKVLRYTSTADPVPGSVQTFFNDYKHFGVEHKFHVNLVVSDWQHSSSLYLDNAFLQYYQVRQELESALGKPLRSSSRRQDGFPVVHIEVALQEGSAKYHYMSFLREFVKDMYAEVLPSYAFHEQGTAGVQPSLQAASKEEQYWLYCELAGRQDRRERAWYIDVEQELHGPKGEILSLATFSKRVASGSGNVKTLALNWLEARAELAKRVRLHRGETLNLLE